MQEFAAAKSHFASVHLDAGELDHLGPLLLFFGKELAVLDRRHLRRHIAETDEMRPHIVVSEAGGYFRIELGDNFGRGASRRADAEPAQNHVTRNELIYGRRL